MVWTAGGNAHWNVFFELEMLFGAEKASAATATVQNAAGIDWAFWNAKISIIE